MFVSNIGQIIFLFSHYGPHRFCVHIFISTIIKLRIENLKHSYILKIESIIVCLHNCQIKILKYMIKSHIAQVYIASIL